MRLVAFLIAMAFITVAACRGQLGPEMPLVDDDDSSVPFRLEQDLYGTESKSTCEVCTYTFDITYRTAISEGVCLTSCGATFADDTYTLAFDRDRKLVIWYSDGAWIALYEATARENRVDYEWYGNGYLQTGYWDMADTTTTGRARCEEDG